MNKNNETDRVKIARQFHWEMGHRLPFHNGECKNLHGHSYRLWVELEGTRDANGMLVDYGDMKALIQPLLDPLDHCFLCDESDEYMKSFLATSPFKVVFVPFTTTAENIVRYLIEQFAQLFSSNERISAITARLAETETSYAEVFWRRESRA